MNMLTKEEVLAEVQKLQYLYGLKHEIRYGDNRSEETTTESVAEHIYGMHILASYFISMEDPEGKWDREKISNLITWHDIVEIETGDIISYLKTDKDRAREETAMQVVIEKSPTVLQPFVTDLLKEYEARESIESQYVKAIDTVEPLCQVFNDNGKQILLKNKMTYTHYHDTKQPHVVNFPHIKNFIGIIGEEMKAEGFFTEETT